MEGKIALVTGASRGIGQACALALAREGATVIGTAISDKGAEAISAYLQKAGAKGRGMKLNVTDAAEVDAVIAAIEKDFGAIGILVNNAGITRDGLLLRMKPEDWDAVLRVNLTGAFNFCKAAVPGMIKQRWGRIVNISSVVGAMGNAGQVNYAASKAGLLGLTKSLAREVASRGVTVNAVAPGFIDTAMTQALPEKAREALLAQIPAGRLGQAADVAAAVLFLASEGAGYVTGQVLHVNGGMYT